MTRKNKIVLSIVAALLLGAGVKLLNHSAFQQGRVEACSEIMVNMIPPELSPVCEAKNGRVVVTVTNPFNTDESKSIDIKTGELVE